uniref:Charged multivesicular body protein 6 n=1 Tax=Ciona savignyi TaxID=51511 RepID=H2YNN0_CIOSA
MGNLFSSKPKSKPQQSRVTEQDKAILELKKQRDTLLQYTKRIENEQEKLKSFAKECLKNGNKNKAKLILKKKKRQETLMTQTEQQIENLEVMANDIEFAQMESNVIEGLKAGNESLKAMHKLMSYEDVEKIMEETQEGIEYQRELDDLLAGSLSQEDEDDILAELDELVGADKVLDLPDAPTDKLEQETKVKKEKKQERTMLAAS